jgi:hypothetical protein
MARRSVRRPRPSKPGKPKAPVLTVEQKRRRIEQFKKYEFSATEPHPLVARYGFHDIVIARRLHWRMYP